MKICRFSAAKIEDDTLSTAKLVSSIFAAEKRHIFI